MIVGFVFLGAGILKVNTSLADTCTDSDGGINYSVAGTVTISSTSVGGGTTNDSCDIVDNNGVLFERYCNSNGTYSTQNYTCPNGCSNGACLSAPITPTPPAPLATSFIKVTYPNGGETFTAGSAITVKWSTSTDILATSQINPYLSMNGNLISLAPFMKSTLNDGSESVTLPTSSITSFGKIFKIWLGTFAPDPDVDDFSDNTFTINSSTTKINGACTTNHLSPCATGSVSATGVTFDSGTKSWSWYCSGVNGGTSSAKCLETITSGTCSIPPKHYTCKTGTAFSKPETTSAYVWDCNGSANGGANSLNCTELKPANGICSTKGNINECDSGTPTKISTSVASYDWTCQGIGTGTSASCTKPRSVDGMCKPTHSNCAYGTASHQSTNSSSYSWDCDGINGGASKSCLENMPVKGECSTNLYSCNSGFSSILSQIYNPGTNAYSWSCDGLNGGVSASCMKSSPINGVCSENLNACISGKISNQVYDATTNTYTWMCNGIAGANAICTASRIYVVDNATAAQDVKEFTTDGTLIHEFGGYGSTDGKFAYPQGIAVAPNGNFYVADYANNRIQEFNANGGFLAKWSMNKSYQIYTPSPNGIAVAPNGNVYVTDGSGSIQEFDANGTYITEWAVHDRITGHFYWNDGIAVDSSGNVYVTFHTTTQNTSGAVVATFSSDDHVEKYASDGTFIKSWGKTGTGNSEFKQPIGIAIAPNGGFVYVADSGNNRIQSFDSNGTYITQWTTQRPDDYNTARPKYLTVDSSGNVYVGDVNNYRVKKYSGGGYLLSFNGVIAPEGISYGNHIGSTVSPANGSCSTTRYACTTGTSINNSVDTDGYSWTCQGSNSGTNTPCTESKITPFKPVCAVNFNGMNNSSCTAGIITSGVYNSSTNTYAWTCSDPSAAGVNFVKCSGTASLDVPKCGSVPYTCSSGTMTNPDPGTMAYNWICVGNGPTAMCNVPSNTVIPAVSTVPLVSSNIFSTYAKINGVVNYLFGPNPILTYFMYGTSPTALRKDSATNAIVSTIPSMLSVSASGLTPNTTYYFEFCGADGSGYTTCGETYSFKTSQ